MPAAPRQRASSTYLPPRLLLLTTVFGRSMAPPNRLARQPFNWLAAGPSSDAGSRHYEVPTFLLLQGHHPKENGVEASQ